MKVHSFLLNVAVNDVEKVINVYLRNIMKKHVIDLKDSL